MFFAFSRALRLLSENPGAKVLRLAAWSAVLVGCGVGSKGASLCTNKGVNMASSGLGDPSGVARIGDVSEGSFAVKGIVEQLAWPGKVFGTCSDVLGDLAAASSAAAHLAPPCREASRVSSLSWATSGSAAARAPTEVVLDGVAGSADGIRRRGDHGRGVDTQASRNRPLKAPGEGSNK